VRIGRRLLGYDRATVEQLIDEVAVSFEATWRERGEFADRIEALEKQIIELRSREELLAHTLVAAEQVASEVRDQAKRAAEAILAESQAEARALLRSAQEYRERLVLESRRIEAMLRASLVMVEEGSSPGAIEPLPPQLSLPEHDATAGTRNGVDDSGDWPVITPPAPRPEPVDDSAETSLEHVLEERVAAPSAPERSETFGELPDEDDAPEFPLGRGPRLVDAQPRPWGSDDTDELDAVALPPAPEPAELGISDGSEEAKSFLRRLAGGSSRDFDWGS
jgi:cell division initiation protein